jgi:hypothetical protein
MTSKYMAQIVIETVLGKRCVDCKWNSGMLCLNKKHPECGEKLFPVGFERKEGKK